MSCISLIIFQFTVIFVTINNNGVEFRKRNKVLNKNLNKDLKQNLIKDLIEDLIAVLIEVLTQETNMAIFL